MKKTVWTFGLIGGAISSALMLLSTAFHDQIGFDKGYLVGYTSMVAAFLMVYFGIRSYRDARGSITFGQGLKVGFAIAAITATCYVATWELVASKMMPDFMDKYTAYEIDKARQAGATDAQLEARRQEIARFARMYQNPLFNIAMTFLEPLPVGVIMTLVSAGILRTRRRQPEEATA